MTHVPYDATRESLYHPGNASDFFQLGPHLDWSKDENEAILCAEMARLAYVKEEDLLVRYLKREGFEEILTIGYGSSGTQLFIAQKPDFNLFVVAFRGTEPDDPSDIFTDAKFTLEPWHDERGNEIGMVHAGFANALQNGSLIKRIKARIGDATGKRILLTGHSLGAALATLTASWMTDASLYTFGSPRVGDENFKKHIQENVETHLRYVDCCDLVTRVPPDSNTKYRHSGKLQYINSRGEVETLPDDSDHKIKADREEAALAYLIKYAPFPGTVWVRELADHAPINYVSGVMGLRK